MDKLFHRKATACLQLMNVDGTPVANKPIDIEQTSHKFLFGCGVFEAVEMMRAETDEQRDFLKQLLDKWLSLFNFGTLPFYWGRYEPEPGKTAKEPTLKAAEWLREHNATLLINDFDTSVAYEILLEGLLEAGVPISAIGIQSHQHQGYWGREKLESVLERYSRFGLPIHFTENTLISGRLMPVNIVDLNDYQVSVWPSTEEGETRQAREITEMYTVLFHHPLVEAITTWDFTDDAWLHAPAGLVRADKTLKPSYHALHTLIHGEWETHEKLFTDSEGYITFTGFKGGYTLITDGQETSLELTEDVQKTLTI